MASYGSSASTIISSTAPNQHLRRHHRRSSSSSSSSLRRGRSHDDVAAASAAAAAAASTGGLLTTEVWFLDNSTRSYSLPRGATAGDLTKAIVERLGLRGEPDGGVGVEDLLPFCGLVESYTGTTLDRPVSKAEPLAALLLPTAPDAHNHHHHHHHTSSSSSCGDGNGHSKLVFLLRAPGFPSLRLLSARDPALLYHRYIQAVHAVITGLLPTIPAHDPPFLLRLACLQLRAKLPGTDTTTTAAVSGPTFARALGNRIVEYIPAAVLGDRRAAEWREGMAALLESDPTLSALSEAAAQQAYLSMVEPLPLFGATLFPGAVADPGTAEAREVVLAVDGAGLGVYDPLLGLSAGKVAAAAQWGLEVMGQWGFYPQAGGRGLFYFTLKAGEGEGGGGGDEVVNFATEWAKEVCEALTVAAYAYLKDVELVGGEGGGVIPVEEEEEEEEEGVAGSG